MSKNIFVNGAREHNLKNVNVAIPKNTLTVFTGVSGSGKSSLAFDTIYAEGKRRYVESLSSYARQFLGIAQKPDFDKIENLSPAISIDQKVVSHNPRSTVGTVTEIYDYFRLLFARVGTPFCPHCNIKIDSQTVTQIIEHVLDLPAQHILLISAPLVTNKKGTHKDLLQRLKRDGFARVKVDGKIYRLDETIALDKNYKHTIDIVVDRLVLDKDDEDMTVRLRDVIETSVKYSQGLIKITDENEKKEYLFSQNFACKKCGFSINELEPRLFSFNSPVGACAVCKGIGIKLETDVDLLIPDRNLSINDGAIVYYKNIVHSDNIEWQTFYALLRHYDIDLSLPIKSLTNNELEIILNGSHDLIDYDIITKSQHHWKRSEFIEGVASMIERRYLETKSESSRRNYRRFLSDKKCYACKGTRLSPQSLCVVIDKKSIADLCDLSIERLHEFITALKFDDYRAKISFHIVNEIKARLSFLNNVGLSYLTLSRASSSLSGGESQRIRLATQIGSKLTGILYVLDEPSIGLHQDDNNKLIATLKSMRDLGNTLIVVEHDEDTIRTADYIVDIGPLAGVHGGEIVCSGTLNDIIACEQSITGQYLSYKRQIEIPKKRKTVSFKKQLVIQGASHNNLQNIDVKFPLGVFTVVTGVSGSGKSTLINDILHKALKRHISHSTVKVGKHSKIIGMENIDKVVHVTQDPIGRTPRSNPATYTGVFSHIRDLFANLPESKARGYLKGRFSFNVAGGRCEKCQGDGVLKIAMHFLPDIYIKCDECKGRRYNDETLQVKYKHHSISDILAMTAERALSFFEKNPAISTILQTLNDVGLGYISLGQSALEFSGGEAQRIKLATYLTKRPTGKSLYLLDEPTTGLHIYDVQKLIDVVHRLTNFSDTVIMIEHNLDVIKTADYVIDLGPGAGEYGGKIVAKGPPAQVAHHKTSLTGKYLRRYF